jgi:hypothetical protein
LINRRPVSLVSLILYRSATHRHNLHRKIVL